MKHGLAYIPIAARHWGRLLLDALWPARCMACEAPVGQAGHLCPDCWKKLDFIEAPLCACCGLPFDFDLGPDALCGACLKEPPAYDAGRAALRYDALSRSLILGFKHGDRTHLTSLFAPWLRRVIAPMLSDVDLIVPVPLHRWRLLRRRYNQSALLAQALAQATGKPWDPLILARGRATRTQGGLTAAQRRRNVQGAFLVPKDRAPLIKGKRLLLVDDVQTTGATLGACARALKLAGAAKVYTVTLARVVRTEA